MYILIHTHTPTRITMTSHANIHTESENMEMLEGKKDLVIHEPSTLLDKVSLKVGIYDGFLVCSVEYTLHLHS